MADAIGPGPLMCIKTTRCDCGENIVEGALYTCDGLNELPVFMRFFYNCQCGEDHLWVHLIGKEHIWCPSLFGPLGDPEAEIKETDEPKVVAPVKPITIEEFAKRYINV